MCILDYVLLALPCGYFFYDYTTQMPISSTCITYKVTNLNSHDYNNKESSFLQVGKHKDIIKYHCIRNGMWDVINIQHPKYPTNKVDTFSQIFISNLEISSHMEKNSGKLGTSTRLRPYTVVGYIWMNTSISLSLRILLR